MDNTLKLILIQYKQGRSFEDTKQSLLDLFGIKAGGKPITMGAEEFAILEQRAAEWLKSEKYDRRTWKDLAPILARFHQKEMERKLGQAEKAIKKIPDFGLEALNYPGAKWLLNHLKEQKQDSDEN